MTHKDDSHTHEDILMSLDQLDQTLEVMSMVVRKLKNNLANLTDKDRERVPGELPELLQKIKWH